jgi:glucose/arabinose dehydrogenase
VPEYPDVANQDFDDVLTANANQIILNIIEEIAQSDQLEAESATLSGPVVDTLHPGFTGAGYADFGNTAGQFIEWNFNAPQAGLYTLHFRYANGSAANRPLTLTVNGVVDQSALAFNPTGAWSTWALSSEQVTLTAGTNTIRLTLPAGDGPNIDYLDLTFDGVVVTPPDAAPTNLTANTASSSQISLFWTDNASNETGYQVERRLASGGSFALIATVPGDSTSYFNTGLSANTQYLYRVRAINAGGESAYSNEANATTLPTGNTTPSVTAVNPGPGATGVFLDRDIVANVSVPNGGISAATLNSSTVRIYPTGSPGSPIPAVLNTSGGGDIIVARPTSNLLPNTSYTFEVTSGLQDITGAGFAPFTSTFTTGTQVSPLDTTIRFEKVTLTNVPTGQYPCLEIGPDGRLYAAGVTGDIFRWDILPDGTLGPRETLGAFRAHNGGNRLLIGLKFDPASTAENLIVWATHSQFAFSGATNFTGKLTRLQGANLENVQDVIINLPRSAQDHVTNQMDFGPDGKLYFLQGSMSAMGAPDAAWSNRPEQLLSAAVLKFDPALWDAQMNGPLDVHTDDGTPYDPFAPGAPLTLFATGVRNAYDLLWHSNGYLYVPTNGSAAGGNTPATPVIPPEGLLPRIDENVNGPYTGPAVPGLTGVGTQKDWLFRVVEGGYYGHPNPSRNEFVLNGGNPTSGADPAQVSEYPVGTQPDRNWRGFAFDFGLNKSPDGVIEYQYGGFGGALVGKLLVARFSSGDDLIVLEPGLDGNIVSSNDAISSFDGFNDPLDLIENPANGFIYVTQYDRAGGMGTITLLRPQEPNITANKTELIFDEVRGGAASAAKTVTITNTGNFALTISSVSFNGPDAALFSLGTPITTPVNVPAGGSLNVNVQFNPPTGSELGPQQATLRIVSNDADQAELNLYLGGLTTIGEEGNNEPSWQWIMDTFRIPIDVGDSNDGTGPIEGIVLPNANNIPRFVKAGPGAVTIESLAIFSGDTFAQPAAIVGWYTMPASLTELFRFNSGDSGQHQEMNPTIQSGVTSFDPGSVSFGMYSQWPTFPGRTVYSENALNTWDAGKQKHVVFPLVDSMGAPVPNAYVVGIEEAANNDFQDLVYIIRNVAPLPAPTADFDTDGDVDGHDFLAWQRGLGLSNAQRVDGDTNADGDVDSGDLTIWKQQFGQGTSVSMASGAALSESVTSFTIGDGGATTSLSGLPELVYGAGNLERANASTSSRPSQENQKFRAFFDIGPELETPTNISHFSPILTPDSTAEELEDNIDEVFQALGDGDGDWMPSGLDSSFGPAIG